MEPAPHPSRILLVDDNLDNLTLLRLFLEDDAYVVMTAMDGQEAVRLFGEGTFDLVLMDLAMPRMDGCEATLAMRELERRDNRPAVPIVILTAHDDDQHRRRCLEAGGTDFLLKPLRKHALLPRIRGYLAGQDPEPAPHELERARPDMDFLRPLLPIFFTTAVATLDRGEEALAMGDMQTVSQCGHRLKGSARTYGFDDLGEAGHLLETAANRGDTASAATALDQARSLMAEAMRCREPEST